jgi:hypothetical protein
VSSATISRSRSSVEVPSLGAALVVDEIYRNSAIR